MMRKDANPCQWLKQLTVPVRPPAIPQAGSDAHPENHLTLITQWRPVWDVA